MASYFDEHNCQPLQPGETPDHYLHFIRLLLDGGFWQSLGLEFYQIFGEKPPPPASQKFVESLKTIYKESCRGEKCAVCLKNWTDSDEAKVLPCNHCFHPSCILPWLSKTNSCPVCRFELPTDDEDYENYRKQKKKEKERQAELEMLHHSMFS